MRRDYYDKNYAAASNEHINRFKMAHMIGVAEYMRERAIDYGLVEPDAMYASDAMYALGLLHDIGYLQGRENHEAAGSYIMDVLGMDAKYSFIISHHGVNPYEVVEMFGKDVIYPEYVLLLEADMSVDARGFRVGFEGRLADIGRRYGSDSIAYKTVQDNIRFIKEYQKENGIASRMTRAPQNSREHEVHDQKRQGKPVNLYHKNKQKENDR